MLGAQCAPYGKGGVIGWFNPYDHMVLLLDGIKKSFLLYKIFRFIEPYQVHTISESTQVINWCIGSLSYLNLKKSGNIPNSHYKTAAKTVKTVHSWQFYCQVSTASV